VAHHLGDLVCHYKDVRDLIRVTFSQPDEQMMLVYHRLPQRIAKAARLDGKWALVTNQPLERGHSPVAYMDWMVAVYHNHRHVERRMRNLKSNLPIRPLYVHRDDETVALCFASLLALTIYTLIERDVQADPMLAAQGLRTTDTLLAATSGLGIECFPHSLRLCLFLVRHAHARPAVDPATLALDRPRHPCASRSPEWIW
jgi:hypothetical protein